MSTRAKLKKAKPSKLVTQAEKREAGKKPQKSKGEEELDPEALKKTSLVASITRKERAWIEDQLKEARKLGSPLKISDYTRLALLLCEKEIEALGLERVLRENLWRIP